MSASAAGSTDPVGRPDRADPAGVGSTGTADPDGVVRLRLPGVLRDLAAGAGELRLSVPREGSSLGGVLDEVGQDWPALARRLRDETGSLRRHVNVFVDGEDVRRDAGLETCLRPGSVVLVLPSVAGG